MANPTPYVPETDFSAEFPGDQGNALDGEFVDIRRTFDELIANLGLIQRDDGRIRNQSVHPDALSSATLLLMASDWTPRGLWATATLYAVGDVVEQAGASYVCVTEHIAGTFTTDRTSGYWIFLTNTADGTIYFDEATGAANAIVTDVALPALSDGLRLRVRALLANTSATVTVQTAAGTLNLKRLGGQALLAGDIVGAGHVLDLVYRASDTTWELLNPGAVDKAATAFSLTLLDDPDATTWRSTLSVYSIAAADVLLATKQPLDATLTAFAALTIAANTLTIGTGADAFSQTTFGASTFPARASTGSLEAKTISDLALTLLDDTTTAAMRQTIAVGTVDQNSQSAAYVTVATDSGKHILHPVADNNPRTFTIDSNNDVPYPIGTCITFVNEINVVTIAIDSDTLTLAGSGSTGSRSLAANGIATAMKVGTTKWMISGTGLT